MSYRIRLCKGLSYCGIVKATRQRPTVLVEDKATADAAVATGYFKLVKAGESAPEGSAGGGEQKPGKTLDEMTVTELETYAAYHNVSLKGLSKKSDIIKKLKEELGDEETENEVDYGSPTMTELQER